MLVDRGPTPSRFRIDFSNDCTVVANPVAIAIKNLEQLTLAGAHLQTILAGLSSRATPGLLGISESGELLPTVGAVAASAAEAAGHPFSISCFAMCFMFVFSTPFVHLGGGEFFLDVSFENLCLLCLYNYL